MRRAIPANRGEEYSALLKELGRHSIEDLCKSGKYKQPITMPLSATVADAMELLSKHDILAAPVVDDNGVYKGWLDQLMLCSFSAEVARRLPPEQRFSSDYWASVNKFRETPISRLAFRPTRKETHPQFSLLHLLENVVELGNVQNQVAVVDSNDVVTGVITVSMLVRWIHYKSHLLKDCLETPLWRIRPYNKVETMDEDAPACEGFLKMSELGVGGIGLTDKHGKLVDALSCRDLRNLRPGSSRFSKLWSSAKAFKAAVANDRAETPSKPVTVRKEDTLGSVLNKLCDPKHPVHRVFVCNEEGHCTDIITGRDILAFFWRQLSMLKE